MSRPSRPVRSWRSGQSAQRWICASSNSGSCSATRMKSCSNQSPFSDSSRDSARMRARVSPTTGFPPKSNLICCWLCGCFNVPRRNRNPDPTFDPAYDRCREDRADQRSFVSCVISTVCRARLFRARWKHVRTVFRVTSRLLRPRGPPRFGWRGPPPWLRRVGRVGGSRRRWRASGSAHAVNTSSPSRSRDVRRTRSAAVGAAGEVRLPRHLRQRRLAVDQESPEGLSLACAESFAQSVAGTADVGRAGVPDALEVVVPADVDAPVASARRAVDAAPRGGTPAPDLTKAESTPMSNRATMLIIGSVIAANAGVRESALCGYKSPVS